MDLRYVMFVTELDRGGKVYEFAVLDRERSLQFAVCFELPPHVVFAARFDVRAWESMRCEAMLWAGIKRESPGTYLDARHAGWLAEVEERI